MFKKFRIGILNFENFYPLRWPIYALNSVVNTELPALLSHRRSTTVSSETYPLYIEDTYSVVNLESPLNVRLLMWVMLLKVSTLKTGKNQYQYVCESHNLENVLWESYGIWGDLSTEKQINFWNRLTFSNKKLILLGSFQEPFGARQSDQRCEIWKCRQSSTESVSTENQINFWNRLTYLKTNIWYSLKVWKNLLVENLWKFLSAKHSVYWGPLEFGPHWVT